MTSVVLETQICEITFKQEIWTNAHETRESL